MSTMAVEVEAKHRSSSHKKNKKRKRAEADGQLELTGAESPKKSKRDKSSQSSAAEQPSATEQPSTTETAPITPPTNSPFVRQRWSLYIPLAPIGQAKPLETACAEHLSPLILTYYPPLKGVVLAYNNPRLAATPEAGRGSHPARAGVVLARSVDEFATSYVWASADFTLFRPQRGQELEGWVNLQVETHIGIVCWNHFTASVERKRLPKSWKWVGRSLVAPEKTKGKLKVPDEEMVDEEEAEDFSLEQDLGHYVNEDGGKLEGLVRFRVVDIELPAESDGSKGFVGITGTLLEAKDEEKVREREVALARERSFAKESRRKEDDALMSGARQGSMEP